MKKVQILDYSAWSPYEGFAEGSGRSEKKWLRSPGGEIGLFKYPKVDPETGEVTTEHISEHMAHQIGNILEMETAHVEIGIYQQRVGCMSYLINKPDEIIVEGAVFIVRKHPDYSLELMQETSSGRYYCLDHLLEVSRDSFALNKWLQMMLFDYLIGNADRHQNNWALLVKKANESTLEGRVCPLYDNGSSLCCYVNENAVRDFLGKDTKRFNALTDTKSRSMIRIDGSNKKRPTHAEIVRELMKQYPETTEFAKLIVEKMTKDIIENLVDAYGEVLTASKVELVKRFLFRKVEMLEQILKR